MKGFRLLEILALVSVGICIDRFWLRPEGSAPASRGGQPAAARTESARDSVRTFAAAPLPARGTSAESASRLAEKLAEVPRMERPKNEKPVLSPELEARLIELAQSPIPRAVKPGEKVNSDGSVDVFGVADDGRKFYRHFDPRGELTKEGWDDEPGGEDVHRAYYESGQLKSLNWNRRDGTKTSIGFTQSGLYEYRWDRLTDGVEISTNYDDAGQVKDVWRRGADGKSVKVQ